MKERECQGCNYEFPANVNPYEYRLNTKTTLKLCHECFDEMKNRARFTVEGLIEVISDLDGYGLCVTDEDLLRETLEGSYGESKA